MVLDETLSQSNIYINSLKISDADRIIQPNHKPSVFGTG